jgi:hypothetical protein
VFCDHTGESSTYQNRNVNDAETSNLLDLEIGIGDTGGGALGRHACGANGVEERAGGGGDVRVQFGIGSRICVSATPTEDVTRPHRGGEEFLGAFDCLTHGNFVEAGLQEARIDDGSVEGVAGSQRERSAG